MSTNRKLNGLLEVLKCEDQLLNHLCEKRSFVYTIIIVDIVKLFTFRAKDIHVFTPLSLNLIVKSTNANKKAYCVSAVHVLFLFQFRARSFGIFRNKNIFWNIFRNIFRLFCSWEQNSSNGNPGIPD